MNVPSPPHTPLLAPCSRSFGRILAMVMLRRLAISIHLFNTSSPTQHAMKHNLVLPAWQTYQWHFCQHSHGCTTQNICLCMILDSDAYNIDFTQAGLSRLCWLRSSSWPPDNQTLFKLVTWLNLPCRAVGGPARSVLQICRDDEH